MVTMVSIPGSSHDGTPPTPDPLRRWWYPDRSNPDQVCLADGTVGCADWCGTGDNHPYAHDLDEQTCRSPQIRLTPVAGGGRSGHARPIACRCPAEADCPEIPAADATVVMQGEQCPGEPPAVLLGIDLAGTEQHVHLTIDEVDKLAADLLTLGMRLEGQHD